METLMKTTSYANWRTPLCRGRWLDCLAAIAIVAFALAILFPAASAARNGGKSALCLANLHVLGKAWLAYHEDNDGWLVGLSSYKGTPFRWVEYPLYAPVYESASVSDYSECNLTYQLNGVRAGKLFAYTQNEQVYHCPNDRYWLTKPYGPWISYSGSGCMNSEDYTARSGMNITGFRSVTLPSGESKKLVCVNKFSQIKTPSARFTFVEEDYVIHGQWRYAGGYVMMCNSNFWSWWDWPAWYHNGSSALGFADGHAEMRVWKDERSILVMQGKTLDSAPHINNQDIVYVNNGYVPAGW